MENEYYILTFDKTSFTDFPDVVNKLENVRWNLSRTEFVIKTKTGKVDVKELKGIKKYNLVDIHKEMVKADWQPSIELPKAKM